MASTSKVLNDQANGARLSRLLVNKGTQALRAALDTYVKHLPSTLAAVLNTNKAILQKLRYKVINPSQWKLLYPSSGTADSKTFDVTLLTVLLRNICGLAPPASGSWDALPPDSDNSIADNIARIKFYRNHVHAHITTTEITDNEFENLWQKISKALISLGIPKAELDELKETPLSPEEDDCIHLLEDWSKREAELDADAKKTLAIIREEFKQKCRESEKVPVVNKLCKCDFSGIKESLNKKFLPGTRQWLFDKFNTWFEDKNSQSNVIILTAGPGVGKSVFASEICRIYDGKKKMAACHFCQYNKSDYSNPRMIIESLASNMCDNVKGFKAQLDDQLKRNHSRETLSDVFRVLLNDPLHALKNRKPMLVVIDALDESAIAGKSEFLELISEEFPKLPQWIKILITSRPELPVKEELKHLNPVEITPHDKDNEEDLLKYLQESLSHICKDDNVFTSLSQKCEGSFLFAYYTQLELKETTERLTIENISELVPQGISGFYKKQFKHLEKQLCDFGSSGVKLKRFLEILVAAEGPLPMSLLPECLGLPGDIEYDVCKTIIGIMSSILPVYDNCLAIYHKSLRDWLMSDGYKKHAFTVDSHTGQEYLWKVCKKEFDQFIPFSKPSPMTKHLKYALAHGISHMIKSASETSYYLSVDVKIVYARLTNQIDQDQMSREWGEIIKNSPSSFSNELLHELKWHSMLFRRFGSLLGILNPAFYLQSLANRINCSTETRLLARSLLEQGHHFWFKDLVAINQLHISSPADQRQARISCCCFSPGGSFLATCANGNPHSILIWDTKLCTVIQVVEFPLKSATGCWWSDNLLWIYDDGLVKIPISNEGTLDLSGARRLDFKPKELLTFSDVLIFIDQQDSVNVARIKNGELQYVEKLPVNDQIVRATVSPCNSIFLMVTSESIVHLWKEDETSRSRHWVYSNTGKLLDFSHLQSSELKINRCKCCITSDSNKGVLLLHFRRNKKSIGTDWSEKYYLIFVDLNTLSSKITSIMTESFERWKEVYAGNSYCIVVRDGYKSQALTAVKLATGEYVAQWTISDVFTRCTNVLPSLVVETISRNDIVAIISQRGRVKFLKLVVPE